jgi:hypothetical protein
VQDEEFIAAVESRKAVEAASAPAAAGKGAKKGAPASATPAAPAEPRITDEDMIELCKRALAKPDCQNLGAVQVELRSSAHTPAVCLRG